MYLGKALEGLESETYRAAASLLIVSRLSESSDVSVGCKAHFINSHYSRHASMPISLSFKVTEWSFP